MLIHFQNMEKPESTNDYQMQNLIINALTQHNSNIASNSGNALFGDNGVLFEQNFNITDEDFYVIAADHGSNFTSPENISLIKTTDLEYTWDNARFGWYNGRKKFISQRFIEVINPSVDGFTTLKSSANKRKDVYLFSRSARFALINWTTSYAPDDDNELFTFEDLNVGCIQNGNTLNVATIKPGAYKFYFFFNSDAYAYVGKPYSGWWTDPSTGIQYSNHNEYFADFSVSIGSHTIRWVNESRAWAGNNYQNVYYAEGANHFSCFVNTTLLVQNISTMTLNLKYKGGLIKSPGNPTDYATYNFGIYLEEV